MGESLCSNKTVVIVILVRVIVVEMRHHDQNPIGEERAYLTYCLQPHLKGS